MQQYCGVECPRIYDSPERKTSLLKAWKSRRHGAMLSFGWPLRETLPDFSSKQAADPERNSQGTGESVLRPPASRSGYSRQPVCTSRFPIPSRQARWSAEIMWWRRRRPHSRLASSRCWPRPTMATKPSKNQVIDDAARSPLIPCRAHRRRRRPAIIDWKHSMLGTRRRISRK